MEIQYIWIKNYNNILKDINLNFGGEYSFNFNEEECTLSIFDNKEFIKNFYRDYGYIKNITGIVGENATGKTSILRAINDILSNYVVDFEYIIIYKTKNQIRGYNNTKLKRIKHDNKIIMMKNKTGNFIKDIGYILNIIYFSSSFDKSDIFNKNKYLKDISTNKEFQIFLNSINKISEIDREEEYISDNYIKDFRSKESYYKVLLSSFINSKKDIDFEMLIPLPKEVIIENRDLVRLYKKKICKRNESYLVDSELFSEFTDIMDSIIRDSESYLDVNKDNEQVKKCIFFMQVTYSFLSNLIYDISIKNNRCINFELDKFIDQLEQFYYDLYENVETNELNVEEYLKDFFHLSKEFLDYILYKKDQAKLLEKQDKNRSKTTLMEDKKSMTISSYIENLIDTLDNEIVLDETSEILKEQLNDCIKELSSITISMNDVKDDISINELENLIDEILAQLRKLCELLDYEELDEVNFPIEDLCKDLDRLIGQLYYVYIEEDLDQSGSDQDLDEIDENNIIIIETDENIKELVAISYEFINNLYQLILKSTAYIENSIINIQSELDILEFRKVLDAYLKLKLKYDLIEFTWQNLSSGQNSYSDMLSRLYKIKYDKEYYTSLKEIMILIDEGELYLHPDVQIKFLDNFIKFLGLLFYDKNIHIVLTSNSPFVISDLPNYSVIYMKSKDGLVTIEADGIDKQKTFGANIHNLLRHSFFMKGGTIGSFAKSKIDKIIQILNNNIDGFNEELLEEYSIEEIRKEIELIGEPVIKNKLLEMFDEIKNKSIDKKFYYLDAFQESELKELKKLIELKLRRDGTNDKN